MIEFLRDQKAKLHLGCGKKPLRGYVNVDKYSANADVQTDIRELVVPEASCDEVLAVHVLEHLTRPDTMDVCASVRRWLKPGGVFVVEMPDLGKCVQLIEDDCAIEPQPPWKTSQLEGAGGLMGDRPSDRERWLDWLAGSTHAIAAHAKYGPCPHETLRKDCYPVADIYDAPGEPHLGVWDESYFRDVLEYIGFSKIESQSPEWHGRRAHRDMRIVATK